MKIKLWVSLEGVAEATKSDIGQELRVHSYDMWRCFNRKGKLDRLNISFLKNNREDTMFAIVLSKKSSNSPC